MPSHSFDFRFRSYGFGEQEQPPFDTIHGAFEHHAASQPHQIAVSHLNDSITYGALNEAANCLAHRLRRVGVVPGTRVCLLVQRSISMVIGIVAILKAGGAYVPLDGGIITDASLEHVINDSQAVVVLTQRSFLHRVSEHPSMCLEDVIAEDASSRSDITNPPSLSSPRDGVYVIYTSGTTGKPKGVDVMHYNAVNLLCLAPGNIGMRPGLKVAQLLNIAFDMCAWEVLGSLANGCTLCLRGKSAEEWKAVLKGVDIVIATPSVLGLYEPADYPNIKFVATAGEVCPQGLADKWSKTAQFFNSCGPTEITIVNTVQPHVYGAPLSIGKPTPNNNVYILDDNLQPLPIGEQGIMWAGGNGVTRGYLNLPDKTAERYRPDPFCEHGSGVMFNTGDIGRWRADGQLEHLGRADDQVKIKGFRVELDGVAAAMETCAEVRVATALLIGKELWGFYVPGTVSIADVKAATAAVQPYYAVPTHFVPLFEFPHTANGKIDKRMLRSIANCDIPSVQETSNARNPPATSVAAKSVQLSRDSRWSHSRKLWAGLQHPVARDSQAICVTTENGSIASCADSALKLQRCKCDRFVGEQLHLLPVSARLPYTSDSKLAARVEVLSIRSSVKPASMSTWHKAASISPSYDVVAGFATSLASSLTCAILFAGREAPAAMPPLISSCAACHGWRGMASTTVLEPQQILAASKERIVNTACALSHNPNVDLVCVVSDARTSHEVVNALARRGVDVAVEAIAQA